MSQAIARAYPASSKSRQKSVSSRIVRHVAAFWNLSAGDRHLLIGRRGDALPSASWH